MAQPLTRFHEKCWHGPKAFGDMIPDIEAFLREHKLISTSGNFDKIACGSQDFAESVFHVLFPLETGNGNRESFWRIISQPIFLSIFIMGPEPQWSRSNSRQEFWVVSSFTMFHREGNRYVAPISEDATQRMTAARRSERAGLRRGPVGKKMSF